MFYEICVYEVKINKEEEFEELIKEVGDFYRSCPGVNNVKYIKRTHRQKDFKAVQNGEAPIKLKRKVGKITYVLYWELENKEIHGKIGELSMKKYFKRFPRCLLSMPKIILGEEIQ
jgi:hypothetical protein